MKQYFHSRPGFLYSLIIHGVIFTVLFMLSAKSIINSPVYHQIAEFKLENTLLKQLAPSASAPTKNPIRKQVEPAKPAAKPVTPVRPPQVEPDAKKVPPVKEQPVVESTEPVKQEVRAVDSAKVEPSAQVEQPKKVMLSESSGGAASQGPWAAYGRSLSLACLKFKHYPAAAIAGRMHGTVSVMILIKADGLVEIGIKTSSGFKMLDDEALRIVDQAVKTVPITDELKNKTKELLIPIGFEM